MRRSEQWTRAQQTGQDKTSEEKHTGSDENLKANEELNRRCGNSVDSQGNVINTSPKTIY